MAIFSSFFDDLPRLFGSDYVPNDQVRDVLEHNQHLCTSYLQDVLHCRVRSTGVIETKFQVNGKYLHMIDVGGQKSERRKWINAFSDIDAILFLVSLSGYDQCMYEDRHAVRFRTMAFMSN